MTGIAKETQVRLTRLGATFSLPARRATSWGMLYLSFLLLALAALLARLGIVEARLAAGVLLVSPVALCFPWLRRRARERRQPELLAERAVRAVDVQEAERLRRAFGLVRGLQENDRRESSELAELHLKQVAFGVSLESVEQKGRGRGQRVAAISVLLFCVVAALLLKDGFAIFEGLNVLVSRGGIAPLTASYLEEASVTAQPPPQVSGVQVRVPLQSSPTRLPAGSKLRYRIVPRVHGRSLVLTDGVQEEAFVSDGRGHWVAELTLLDPAELRVAAVFGDVRVFDRESLRIATIEDAPPSVMLRGGARELPLDQLDRLELEFAAQDDYGLSSLELVVRTGSRQDVQELARFGEGQRRYVGAHAVLPSHPLMKGAFLPVQVWIEAKDNNPVSGSGVGKSEVVTLLPRPLGSVLGQRHVKLREFRAALVDGLADDLSLYALAPLEKKKRLTASRSVLEQKMSELERSLQLGGEPPRGSLQFLRAQMDALTGKGDVPAIESFVLATDVLMSQLAQHDARETAEVLAAACDEVAVRVREQSASRQELELLLAAVRAGAAQLREIGDFGLDLGSVAEGDLGRVEVLVREGRRSAARAAALHLAARLRRGTPSFGSKGGGVETGAPAGGGAGAGPPSTAPTEYDELTQAADALAQEHARQLSELERMLEEASRAAAADAASDPQLQDAADELRDALSGLPSLARYPGTADAAAAQARNFGDAMADALEAGRLEEAAEQGGAASDALRRASELLRDFGGLANEESVEAARDAISAAQRLVEQAKQSRSSSSQQRSQLRDHAARERELARKVRELAARGRQSEVRLPESSSQSLQKASRLMEEAARAMEEGDGAAGRELALDAQSALERAQPEKRESESGRTERDEAGEDASGAGRVDVPGESRDGARDFRERVEKGLGRYSGRFGPAVRRYAEELK